MDRYAPSPGTPVEQLDTPCLIVDMDAYESNLQVVADTYRDTPTKMRAHTKNLKSPSSRTDADRHRRHGRRSMRREGIRS